MHEISGFQQVCRNANDQADFIQTWKLESFSSESDLQRKC